MQLSAGQNPTITTVTNHIDEKEKLTTTPVSSDSTKSQSNMEASEPFTNGISVVSSASSAPNHNGADVDVNLESEERDEFIEIKVSFLP